MPEECWASPELETIGAERARSSSSTGGGEAGLIEGLEFQGVVKGWVLVGHQVRVVALPVWSQAPPAETQGQQQGAQEQQAAGGTQAREDEHEAGLGGEGGARLPPARGMRLAQSRAVGRLDAHAVRGARGEPVQGVLPGGGVDVPYHRLVAPPALRRVADLVAAHHRVRGAPADKRRCVGGL